MDWVDFAVFNDCVLGPAVVPPLSGWLFYDSDLDHDVDLRDVSAWVNVFTGD